MVAEAVTYGEGHQFSVFCKWLSSLLNKPDYRVCHRLRLFDHKGVTGVWDIVDCDTVWPGQTFRSGSGHRRQ